MGRSGRMGGVGFTLIELLLVVAILGISLAVIVPRLGGMLDGGQAAVAARTVLQAGRYARSMALLNQLPLDLVLDLGQSEVRVEAGGAGDNGSTVGTEGSGTGGGSAEGGAPVFGRALSRDDRDDAKTGLGFRSPHASPSNAIPEAAFGNEPDGGMLEEVGLRRKLAGVTLGFGGYQDRSDLPEAGETVEGVVRVRYRANGTCRPYQVSVSGARTGERFVVSVDGIGTPTLLRPEEAGRESGRGTRR